jgi:hypothetical protein
MFFLHNPLVELQTMIEAIDRAIDDEQGAADRSMVVSDILSRLLAAAVTLVLQQTLPGLQHIKLLLFCGRVGRLLSHERQRCAFLPRPAVDASSHPRCRSCGNATAATLSFPQGVQSTRETIAATSKLARDI